MLFYSEVFSSIQGESSDSGFLCVFVRLFGCNVSCNYCDQRQNKKDRKRISIDNLFNLIQSFRIKNVCITGGEPLIQPEVYSLIYYLVEKGYKVSIETNGCVPIDLDLYNRSYKYIMDVKCPSSGVSSKNVYQNLANLKSKDEVKFVIADKEDYKFTLGILRKYPTMARILFSPLFNLSQKPVVGMNLIKWMQEDRLENVRVNVQIHKILNVP